MAQGGKAGWIAGIGATLVMGVATTVIGESINTGKCPGALARVETVCTQLGLELAVIERDPVAQDGRAAPSGTGSASSRESATKQGKVPGPAPVEVSGTGDGAASRLAADVEPGIRQRLRAVPELRGARIAFELSGLDLAGGADRRVQARWVVDVAGKPPAQCGPVAIIFYSGPVLAEKLTARFDASLAATAGKGEPTCT